MTEFIEAILSPVNLVLTVLLGCFVSYWLIVLLGLIDLDALDVDFEVDLDADADVSGHVGDGGVIGVLKFLNVGEVPLMILLTTFVMVLWLIGVMAHLLVGEWSVGVQLLALIPMIIVGVLATKVLTQPLRKLFEQLDADASAGSVTVMGQRCTVVSATVTRRSGQAEILAGAVPVKINVRTTDDADPLKRGDEAVVVQDRDERGVYVVRGF
jgi:hypothetical protein